MINHSSHIGYILACQCCVTYFEFVFEKLISDHFSYIDRPVARNLFLMRQNSRNTETKPKQNLEIAPPLPTILPSRQLGVWEHYTSSLSGVMVGAPAAKEFSEMRIIWWNINLLYLPKQFWKLCMGSKANSLMIIWSFIFTEADQSLTEAWNSHLGCLIHWICQKFLSPYFLHCFNANLCKLSENCWHLVMTYVVSG